MTYFDGQDNFKNCPPGRVWLLYKRKNIVRGPVHTLEFKSSLTCWFLFSDKRLVLSVPVVARFRLRIAIVKATEVEEANDFDQIIGQTFFQVKI